VSLVLSSWYQNYLRFDPATAAIDAGKIDWDAWLGSAPKQPVDALRYLRWRWFWDFGGGHLTDLHSHWGDTIHWFMDSYAPIDAQAVGGNHAIDYFECPDTINCAWTYPGFTLVYDGTLVGSLEGGNIIFRGSRAMMKINRDGFAVYPEGVIRAEGTQYPEPDTAMKSSQDGTIDHIANWLECIRSRKEPNSPVRLATAAAKAAHIGNQAYRQGTRVKL
jgi:predicted dehydrogenase